MPLPEELPQGETVELTPEDPTVVDTEDGGAIIKMENEVQALTASEHFANIVDIIPKSELATLSSSLLDKIEQDKEARKKRDELYEEGIRRTGLGNDAPGGASFTGATRVVHPLLVEACVDFSARAMKEIFPSTGPVKSKVNGKQTLEKLSKAQRKADFMNWQCTQQIKGLRGELEQLTTQLPLGGDQFLKVSWDATRKRPVVTFVPIDNMLLPFAATNFYTAERRTEMQYITQETYEKRVKSGMYRDVDLTPAGGEPEFSRASKANDKIEGRVEGPYNTDGLRLVYESTTCADIEGESWPYIITIDDTTHQVLGIYRNWESNDDQYEELSWAVEFPFIPWRGVYAIGLTHLIGGLSGAATGALRALLDSAHINNLPGMMKLKGGGPGKSIDVQATQITEIDGGAMVDDIRKLVMPMPFNPPSAVLFQLLGFLVDAGKGVVQTSFEKLSEMKSDAPVGTTMALIEQGMVVFSSIHSRLHSAMAMLFSILHRLNSAYLTDELIEAYGSGIDIKAQDFDGALDVIPVSDPAVFSDAQRFAQVQALQQRSAVMPEMYNMRRVEEMFLRTMRIDPETVLQSLPGSENMDPVSENVAATMGRPIYVLPHQDHMAHIKVHLGFLRSKLLGSNPVIARTYMPPISQHLRDHLLNLYLTQTHESIDKAEEQGLPITDGAEQANLILMVQRALEGQLGGFEQELVQVDQAAQQFIQQNQPPMPQDNALKIAELNAQQRAKADMTRAQNAEAKLQQDAATDQADRESKEKLAMATLQQRNTEQEAMNNRVAFEQQSADSRAAVTNQSRERISSQDNETAKELAAMEIVSGNDVAVSTGNGINPGT